MQYRVVIHDRAKADIRRNAQWWADHHSTTQAEKWFHFAFDSLEKLEHFPLSHSVATENSEFPFELRELLFGLGSRPGYRALFAIKETEVHVFTVRRATEDRVTSEDLRHDFDA